MNLDEMNSFPVG
jgi:hypothetical protein